MDYVTQIGLWTFLPELGASALQSLLYYIIPAPQNGTPEFVKHKRLCYITVIIGYLIYSLVKTEGELGLNYYHLLETFPSVDGKTLKSTYRKLSLLYHPVFLYNKDKAQPGFESHFVLIGGAYDVLKDSTKRLAYDHFGPDVFSCEGCRTYPDFMSHHMISVGMYYAITASTAISLVLLRLGPFAETVWWRFVSFCAVGVLELYMTVAVEDPIPFLLHSRTIYEKVSLLRHLLVVLSIALSQIGPYFFPRDNRSVRELLIQLEDVLLQETHSSDQRLQIAFAPFKEKADALRTRLEQLKVEETLECDPEFIELMRQEIFRVRLMDFIPNSLIDDIQKLKTKGKTRKPTTKLKEEKPDSTRPRQSVLPKQVRISVKEPAVDQQREKKLSVGPKEVDDRDLNRILTPIEPKKDFKEIVLGTAEEPQEQEEVPLLRQDESYQMKVLTTRKEVTQLKNSMRKQLDSLQIDEKLPYPTEMHLFVNIIREEQKIYDKVLQEIIRQVTVNMVERGELLSEVRNRYATMFQKIPEHVLNLHTELVAHRKLNRRLSEELLRAKEHISELCKEVEFVREHDQEVNEQAREAQEKLVQLLNNQESNEESMEEFHKLYKMQRSRLESQVKIAEREKRLWINAATSLALRVSEEFGISDLVLLQKHEEGRLRITNHMVVNISDANANDLHAVEVKIDEWRMKLTQISKSIVEEDYRNIELLGKLQRQIRKVLKNLITNEPQNDIELGHKLLTEFHIFDVQSLGEHLHFWTTELTEITQRFMSGKENDIKDDIAKSRRMTNVWVDLALRLLRRNQDSTSGEDYLPLTAALKSLQADIFEWCNKLETRALGEDGITNLIIMIQTQIEDRYANLTARGLTKPLTSEDRQEMIQNLNHLVEQTGVLINTLSNTAEREQHKIPLQVEHWIARVLEQMNNDVDSRNEDNINVHTNLVSWMVNLLLPVRNVEETKEVQFEQLTQQLLQFNTTLLRDAADMEMITDDKRDMRKLLQDLCASWISIGQRLLKADFTKQPEVKESKPIKPDIKVAPEKEPKLEVEYEMRPNPVLSNLKSDGQSRRFTITKKDVSGLRSELSGSSTPRSSQSQRFGKDKLTLKTLTPPRQIITSKIRESPISPGPKAPFPTDQISDPVSAKAHSLSDSSRSLESKRDSESSSKSEPKVPEPQ